MDKQPETRDLLTLTRQGMEQVSDFPYNLIETTLTYVTTAILAAIVPWSTQCVLQVRMLLEMSRPHACLPACQHACLPAYLDACVHMHACLPTCLPACLPTCLHDCLHANMTGIA